MVAKTVGDRLDEVRALTRDVVRRLLEFHTAWQVNRYLNEVGQRRYDELEAELHNNYDQRGLGVRVTRTNVDRPRGLRGGFLVEDVPLAPEDAVGEIWRFPLNAAAAAYAFAILEAHGNELADVMEGARHGNDWHRAVSVKFDPKRPDLVKGARKQMAEAFGIPRTRIKLRLLSRVAELKALRNRIVHEGHFSVPFGSVLGDILSVACDLHFACAPGDKEVVVYPWADFEDDFHPQHEKGVHFRRD